MSVFDALRSFLIGGFVYVGLELLWRGYSHASMFLAGGAAFTLLYALCVRFSLSLPVFCLIGGTLICAVEFTAGYIVNVRLGLCVWDYSAKRYNLYGQVCLKYLVLWVLLCVPVWFFIRILESV